jgi:hypothetical protein
MSTATTSSETEDNTPRRPAGKFANRWLAKVMGERGDSNVEASDDKATEDKATVVGNTDKEHTDTAN